MIFVTWDHFQALNWVKHQSSNGLGWAELLRNAWSNSTLICRPSTTNSAVHGGASCCQSVVESNVNPLFRLPFLHLLAFCLSSFTLFCLAQSNFIYLLHTSSSYCFTRFPSYLKVYTLLILSLIATQLKSFLVTFWQENGRLGPSSYSHSVVCAADSRAAVPASW